MSIKDTLSYIYFNLLKNKKRIVLTCFSVILSLTTIILINIITTSMKNNILGNIEKNDIFQIFLLNKDTDEYEINSEVPYISDAILDQLVHTDERIEKVVREQAMGSISTFIPRDNKVLTLTFGFDHLENDKTEGNFIEISEDVLELVDVDLKIGDSLIIDNITYKISRIFIDDTLMKPQIIFNENNYLRELNWKVVNNTLNIYLKPSQRTKSEKQAIIAQFIQKINETLSDNTYQYRYEGAIFATAFVTVFDSIANFLSIIGLIILLISSIGIANVMYISVLERKEEIVTLKLLGMNKKTVKFLFLLESVCIMLFSTLTSLFISSISAILILNIMNINFSFSTLQLFFLLLIVLILGLLVGNSAAKTASDYEL